MKNRYLNMLVILSGLIALAACKKEKKGVIPEKPFALTDNFIGGTLTPQNNSYTSVYLISFLADNKATYTSSGRDFDADYVLTKDSLIVTVSDPNNYKTAKFAINSDHKLTSAYYRALTKEYAATGELIAIAKTNQLLGKVFKGEEFKFGGNSNRKDLYFKFNATALSYGTGIDKNALDDTTNGYQAINNSAFKYKNGDVTELGFLSGKQLTTFRVSGLYYYGKFLKE